MNNRRFRLGFNKVRGMLLEVPGRGMAHSKVMVIDRATVITGSFNFNRQAETTNVENLAVFHDSHQIADIYTAIWKARSTQAARH
jgi:phosphatidylserine/phosphatidylglycerophosphate/cardiolipin synthase-like enzyme